VGAVWWTGSKKLKKPVLGVRNVEEVVKEFGGPAVAIGERFLSAGVRRTDRGRDG
jgi:hypothetical protein